jgi:pilus assembly protein Flp/PilA
VPGDITIRRFLSDERGATAIEYGLICAMIAVVVLSIASVGGALSVTYETLNAIIDALGGSGNNGS